MHEEQPEYQHLFKTVLVGDKCSGKTCIVNHYKHNQFTDTYVPTIGVEINITTMDVDDTKTKTQLWDTAGQVRFRPILGAYINGASGLFIVYDVTNEESLSFVTDGGSCFHGYITNVGDHVVKILVGNKCDLHESRVISYQQGKAVADAHGMLYIETSAKTGQNVEQLFVQMVARMLQKLKDR